MAATNIARVGLFLLGMIGVIGVAPIAWQQFTGAMACPALGLVPACHIVLIGYLLVVISVFLASKIRTVVFLVGWVPLFVLALSGSGLELFVHDTCPRTSGGIPTCYLSLGLLVILGVISLTERRLRK